MNTKILLIGDTHSNFQVLEQIIVLEQPVAVIHAGDFGLYDEAWQEKILPRDAGKIIQHKNPVEQFWPYLRGERKFPIPVYFIPGNHEDFRLWNDIKNENLRIKNLIPLDELRIRTIPIGEKEMTCQGLGRILPFQASRKKDSYFTDQEYKVFRDKGKEQRPDLLVFHEPPYLFDSFRKRSFGNPLISAAIKEIKPRCVFIGHMHFEYQVALDQAQIYGLGYGSAGRYAILRPDFSVEFKSLSPQMPGLHEVSLKSFWASEDDLVRDLEKLHAPLLPVTNKTLPISGKEIINHFPGVDKTELTKMFSKMSRAFKNEQIKTKEDCLNFAIKWENRNKRK